MFISFSYRKNLSNVGYFSGSKKKSHLPCFMQKDQINKDLLEEVL